MGYSWLSAEFVAMKLAAFALACVLSAAARADAAEPLRGQTLPPFPPVSQTPKKAPDQVARPRGEAVRRNEPPHERTCFNAAETREKITTHRLTEPFLALRAGRLQGEALRAKLCRWKPDEFVYEVAVLRRDGRIVHVFMNALNGQSVDALSGHE